MGIKDEDLAGLSDEERAALEDDDDESDILKSIAGDDDDDADDDNSSDDGEDDDPADDDDATGTASDDDDDTGAVDDGKAAAGDTSDADPDKGDKTTESAPVIAEEFQPEFKAAVPDDIAAKLTDLDDRTKALMTKFKDGEIELPDFMEQKAELDNEKLQLSISAKQAEWAQQQNTDSREQRWKWEQERFFSQDKAAIYKDDKDPIALAALNATVKQLASDPANNRRPPGWFLEEADRRVRERFNLGGTAKPAAADPAKKAAREPDLSKVPKTLANLPAADIAETGSDEFAYLDKLDGIALEQALRKLTPEQEARYLGAAA